MKNYLIVNNNNRVFEAFNCMDEKSATKIYLSNFVPNDNEMKKIFDKASESLSIDEMCTLFFKLFDWYVDDTDKIKNIYSIGEKIYE